MGQLFFRNPTLNHVRNTRILRVRFKQFAAGDFHLVVAALRRDYDKSLLKERHLRQDNDASRAVKAVKYVRNGFISKATNLVQSFGVPLFVRRDLCADVVQTTPNRGACVGATNSGRGGYVGTSQASFRGEPTHRCGSPRIQVFLLFGPR